MATNFGVVDNSTQICVNIVVLDNASEWNEPDSFVLQLDITPSLIWHYDFQTKTYDYQEEFIGYGGIGFAWNGTQLVQPKP
jgi:hypothetical protein